MISATLLKKFISGLAEGGNLADFRAGGELDGAQALQRSPHEGTDCGRSQQRHHFRQVRGEPAGITISVKALMMRRRNLDNLLGELVFQHAESLEYVLLSDDEKEKYLKMLMYCTGLKEEQTVSETVATIYVCRELGRKLKLSELDKNEVY